MNTRLKEILEIRDVSYAWLGRRLGIGRASVMRWAKGDTAPTKKRYPAIARALSISESEVEKIFSK